MIRQFDQCFESSFRRVFAILPNCAAGRGEAAEAAKKAIEKKKESLRLCSVEAGELTLSWDFLIASKAVVVFTICHKL